MSKTTGKTITLRLNPETYSTFVSLAEAENRSLSNFIETSVIKHIRQSAFIEDYEMQEINSNKDLLKRLRRGSREAKIKKGKFVE